MLAEVLRRDLVDGLRPRLLLGRRPEERQPDILGLLEYHLDGLSELELVGFALNDVRGQPNPRVLDDRDLCDHIWRREVGKAEPVVDGEGRQGGFAGDIAHAHVATTAVPAHRGRRMDQRIAVLALLNPKNAVGACGPEEFVLRVEFWQRSGQRTKPQIASLSSDFGSGSGVSRASSGDVPSSDGRCSPM